MDIFETVLCIPSYFVDELIGILLLGKKLDGSEFDKDEVDFSQPLLPTSQWQSTMPRRLNNSKQAFADLKNEA